MSTWGAIAIERIGSTDPSWPTIWGPAAGSDPITANNLHTLDLTTHLLPLKEISQTLERDLTKSAFGSVTIELSDPDGSIAASLGPASTMMATASRYFGPWVKIQESWPVSSDLARLETRFLGILDETSLEWDEETGTTTATVIHASQILRERLLSEVPGLLRPFPSTPAAVDAAFQASTGDAILDEADVQNVFTPRADALAREQALWAHGRISWCAYQFAYADNGVYNYGIPGTPSPRVQIGSTVYAIDHVAYPESTEEYQALQACYTNPDPDHPESNYKYSVAVLHLAGDPDLSGILSVGTTVTFLQTEAERTHYLLRDPVIAPESGTDGPTSLRFDTIEQLIAGDDLEIAVVDTTTGKARSSKLRVKVLDVDGERNLVHLQDPINQALPVGTKIRRPSREPVHVDGLALARAAAAPFALGTTHLLPAAVSRPVLSWLPQDVAQPALYGVSDIWPLDAAGTVALVRRGYTSDGTNSPVSGIWTGPLDALQWHALQAPWNGSADAALPLRQYGQVTQFPGDGTPLAPPALYVLGDLSGGSVPPNGWRHRNRTLAAGWTTQRQGLPVKWDGSAIVWGDQAATSDFAGTLYHYVRGVAPGLYRISGTDWTFAPHSAAHMLDTAASISPSGTLPSGGAWLEIGMGVAVGTSGHEEALLGLYVTGSAFPWTKVQVSLFAQGSGGALAAQAPVTLWDVSLPGASPAGPWRLGGGLALNVWEETINAVSYPHTRLFLVDGSGVVQSDLSTLEVIPGTIQPLSRTGTGAAARISGWACLAVETYAKDADTVIRRVRFLLLSSRLAIINGDPEPDPVNPDDSTRYFRRGEIVVEQLPAGVEVHAKLVRLGLQGNDRMVGFCGGRLCVVGTTIPRTVERLKIDDTPVSDLLDNLGLVFMATFVPTPDGGLDVVSRSSGTIQHRANGTDWVSVELAEQGPQRVCQSAQALVSRVNVSFDSALLGENTTVTVEAPHAGGKPMDLSLGSIVGGECAARSLGMAVASWFGYPSQVRSQTWSDSARGLQSDLVPPFWASWRVGDLLGPMDGWSSSTTTLGDSWKITSLKQDVEARTCEAEIQRLPVPLETGVLS